jgi:hypothetical protein
VTGKVSKGSKAMRQKPRKVLSKVTKVKPTVVIHPMTDMAKGDDCAECETGKVYKALPTAIFTGFIYPRDNLTFFFN